MFNYIFWENFLSDDTDGLYLVDRNLGSFTCCLVTVKQR